MIKFHRANPGKTGFITTPLYIKRDKLPDLLDPTHETMLQNGLPLTTPPTTASLSKMLPAYLSPSMTIRAWPTALLVKRKPRPSPFLPQGTERRPHTQKLMPMMNFLTIKRLGKSAIVRKRTRGRFRAIVQLVVLRGAHVLNGEKGGEVVFSEQEAGYERWLLKGMLHCCFSSTSLYSYSYISRFPSLDWLYTFYPTLELYRLPTTEFITAVRKALRSILRQGQKLDDEWKRAREERESGSISTRSLLRDIQQIQQRRRYGEVRPDRSYRGLKEEKASLRNLRPI